MRILFVLTNYYPYIGGSEVAFKRLAEGLSLKGHSIYVITSSIDGVKPIETMNGVYIHRLRIPKFAYQFLFNLFSFPLVIRYAQEVDVIHTASNYGALVAWIAGFFTRKPVVFTCHEVLGNRWHLVENPIRSIILRIIEFIIIRLPYHKYVAVSDATRADLLRNGIDIDKIATIYWGLDQLFSSHEVVSTGELRERVNIKDDDFLYVYYGRPGSTKGVDYLVRAVPEILRVVPNSHLVLILSEEPKARFKSICNLVHQLSVDAHVHILPAFADRNELAHHLKDADCIVVPSITEGFGLTTVEACELGIPVVATSVGPIPQLIFGRYLLIAPSSTTSIAEGIEKANKEIFEFRAKPTEFSWENTVQKYCGIYRMLM